MWLRTLFFATFFYLLLFAGTLNAQKCVDFHTGFCAIPDFSFFYNQQSKSFELKLGQSAEIRIIAYENTEYFISACAHRKYKKYQLRILEDNEKRSILFDNSRMGYIDSVKFINQNTRKLVLEITIPEEGNSPEQDDGKPKCAGILIATRMREQ